MFCKLKCDTKNCSILFYQLICEDVNRVTMIYTFVFYYLYVSTSCNRVLTINDKYLYSYLLLLDRLLGNLCPIICDD